MTVFEQPSYKRNVLKFFTRLNALQCQRKGYKTLKGNSLDSCDMIFHVK